MTLVWHRDPLGRVWRRAETQAETANSERPGGGPRLTMVWNPQHVAQQALESNQADEDPAHEDEQIPANSELPIHARPPPPALSREQRCLTLWEYLTGRLLEQGSS